MSQQTKQSKAIWVGVVLVPVGFVLLYWATIQGLVRQWLASDDYSHGLLVLPIALFLIWQKRAEIERIDLGPDWRALVPILASLGLSIIGELGAELFTTCVSMIALLISLVWFLFGFALFKTLIFPLAFLFLMLPLPGFIHRNLTFPLQLVSSMGAVEIMEAVGVSAFREGNIIDIGITQLQVVEACNGLRYILPLLTFGVLYAYLRQGVLWKQVVLVLATLPIAVFANMIRIAGAGVAGTYYGRQAVESFFHASSAIVVILFCAGLFILFNALLNRLPGRAKPKAAPRDDQKPGRVLLTWPSVATALVILLLTQPVVAHLSQVPPAPLRKPLIDFPLDFRGWEGVPRQMEAKIWEQVGGQDYVIIDYVKEPDRVNFYVAYYEVQKKGGDFVHTPRLCLPGGGWFIEEDRIRRLSGSAELELNELVIQKGGFRQLVYFWYQGRGRNFTNEFAAKFWMVWDGILRRRTDGALVRLVMPFPSDMDMAEARRILDPFALAASQKLQEFLPE